MTPLKSSNRRDLNRSGLRVSGGDGVAAAFCARLGLGVLGSCGGSWGTGWGWEALPLREVCREQNREDSHSGTWGIAVERQV